MSSLTLALMLGPLIAIALTMCALLKELRREDHRRQGFGDDNARWQ